MPLVIPWAFASAGRPVYVSPRLKFGTPFPSAAGMYPPACHVEMPESVHPPSNPIDNSIEVTEWSRSGSSKLELKTNGLSVEVGP